MSIPRCGKLFVVSKSKHIFIRDFFADRFGVQTKQMDSFRRTWEITPEVSDMLPKLTLVERQYIASTKLMFSDPKQFAMLNSALMEMIMVMCQRNPFIVSILSLIVNLMIFNGNDKEVDVICSKNCLVESLDVQISDDAASMKTSDRLFSFYLSRSNLFFEHIHKLFVDAPRSLVFGALNMISAPRGMLCSTRGTATQFEKGNAFGMHGT